MKKPLSYILRPKKLEDIVGQDELLNKDGLIYKMINEKQLFSLIITGNPGCGKTSIAKIIADNFSDKFYFLNASCEGKQILKDIKDELTYKDNVILIIDEIHRMKKDTQDFLLPFLEDGSITLIGLTTENPYYSINPAIRSRCHILKLKELTNDDILKILYNALESDVIEYNVNITNEALKYIAQISNNEARKALNMLELVLFNYKNNDLITLNDAKKLLLKPNLPLDSDKENYYQLLSALQKSIRGSDVNASIHYLARLVVLGDLISITRRLIVIAYEDVSLGNPQLLPRVVTACDAALKIGLPEARIILANIVVDMALSPKSNSTYLALDEAINDFNNGIYSEIPKNIINSEIKFNNETYLYPHDYKDDFVIQNYMPHKILYKKYYKPKTNSNYETILKERYEKIDKLLDKAKENIRS